MLAGSVEICGPSVRKTGRRVSIGEARYHRVAVQHTEAARLVAKLAQVDRVRGPPGRLVQRATHAEAKAANYANSVGLIES